ncbi:ATP-binding protein [Xanthovirga aplysinae]|uniref:ATP-binding protein n=1 Tax=Xanthovirga aplysinae TaxID=2529853 RepID=UPI0012BBAEAD|nr:ATP-binding protein [Xanthovirga aplysinae]MTI32078.1 ATP-binding protein [Xanthovirga aplysinae]
MKYKFTASCSKNKLKSIREFVEDVLRECPLSEAEAHKLVLAVDEVCANLMIHSNQCNPKENLELQINIQNNKGITFEISDRGEAFNPNTYIAPSVQQIVKEKRKGGMGLLLVKHIMDDIEFCCNKDQNVCRLYKKFNLR